MPAPTNVESVWITALILALITSPVSSGSVSGIAFLLYVSAWAMASKYILAPGKKHIFNPAAFGVALASLTAGESATWWVAGNLWLLPVVFVGGVLIVRKLRRADLVWSFAAVVLTLTALTAQGGNWLVPIVATLEHSAFFFLAFVMLTEPLTMPPGRTLRVMYGALVGLLFIPAAHIGSFYFTPELALLAGNLFAWAVSPKGRFMFKLVERKKLGTGVWEFAFATASPMRFKPGQYLEWTLPHQNSDSRGNRRYFTIASSPTEGEVRMGIKFYEPMSSFKRALARMQAGDIISASHLSGDFVLPRNPNKKLVFIAGGIGATPFRSMVQYLLDRGERRDVDLFYAARNRAELAYQDIFDRAAAELGVRVNYQIGDEGGRVSPELIKAQVPDYRERTFYISGPRGMVEEFKAALRAAGVSRWKIKTDYFPGFA